MRWVVKHTVGATGRLKSRRVRDKLCADIHRGLLRPGAFSSAADSSRRHEQRRWSASVLNLTHTASKRLVSSSLECCISVSTCRERPAPVSGSPLGCAPSLLRRFSLPGNEIQWTQADDHVSKPSSSRDLTADPAVRPGHHRRPTFLQRPTGPSLRRSPPGSTTCIQIPPASACPDHSAGDRRSRLDATAPHARPKVHERYNRRSQHHRLGAGDYSA